MEINTMITRTMARLGDSGIGSDHLLLPTVPAVQGGTLPTPRRVVIAGPAAVASNGEGVAFAAAYAASPKTDVHRSATGSPPV